MDTKENADRAATDRKLALQRQQQESQAQAQAAPTPAPEVAPATQPTTEPAVAQAPTTPDTSPAAVPASPTTGPQVAQSTPPADAATEPAAAPTPAPTTPAPVAAAPSTEDRALEDLKATARLQEIQRQQDQYDSQQKTRAAVAAESNNLDQARQLYSQAVSLDPDNATAKAGLSRVLILQGRSTQNTSLLGEQAKRIQTQIQEITYSFDQAIADARAAIGRGQFQAASTDIQRAQVARNQNPNIFTPEALRNFDNQIRQTQLALDTAQEQAKQDAIRNNEMETATRLAKQQADQETQRHRTVQDLRATAMRLTEEARYREALGVVDQILVLDPTNEYATGVRPLLEDKFNFQQQRLFMQQKDLNFTRQLNAAEEKMIPYDDILRYPADWPDISQTRDQTVQSERGENKEDRAVQAQLDRPLPELTFDGVGFNDVVDFLRDVSGANIFVNWKSLEGAGIDRNAPVTAKLRNVKFSKALNIILDSVGGGTAKLGYTIDDGVITIATAEELGKNTSTRVYDIRDLIINIPDFNDAPDFSLTSQSSGSQGGGGAGGAGGGGGGGGGGGQGGLFAGNGQQSGSEEKGPTRQELVDQIIKLITDTVAPDSWRDAGGSVGSIKELSGQLIVTQTPENQRNLVNLLEQLRETRAIQVTVETRFLTVQRNFMDDVGVDLNLAFNINGKNSSVFGGPNGAGTFIPVLQQSSQFTQLPTTGVPGSIGNTPVASTATGLSTAITYLDDFQVSLLLRATEVTNTATEVTAPRVTLFNGQRAYVLVATQKAYVSNLTAAVGTGVSSFTPTVSVVETGVLLDVSATVSADRKYVTLTLRPELSNLLDIENFTFQQGGSTIPGGTTASPIVVGGVTGQAPTGTIQVPEIQLTEVKTTVSVPDGGTLLLGGQTLAGEVEKEAGVPVLSKIPFLKRLFTNRSMAKDEQILLILVKPTILIEKEIEQKQFPLLTSKLGT